MTSAVPLGPRSLACIAVMSVLGLLAFGWPLLVEPGSRLTTGPEGPWLFALLIPLLLAVVLAEVAEGGLDAKSVALLGVLTAVAAALRPLSGGVTGFQPMFVVLILAGRVFGPGFGFVLGSTSMVASALLTGGVGPWLPFQMLGAAWIGLGAGLLPRCEGKLEIGLLALYGGVSSLAYGLLLNLWFWPFLATTGDIAFVAGAPIHENLGRLLAFTLATSLGFDIPRALGSAVLLVVVGAPALAALRRTHRRARFSTRDEPGDSGPPSDATPPSEPAPLAAGS
ncbi:MAG TPA: ECF transporter S component [Actinomycetes bacterium]|nr:ECF transporter S component [Actinomycetes bacterium]